MKVFVSPPAGVGRAIYRVADAMIRYAPAWVEVVGAPALADLRVWHAMGPGERDALLQGLIDGHKHPYAIFQHCFRASDCSQVRDWADIWRAATCVWCAYDLARMAEEDTEGEFGAHNLPHYHAPLGVEADVFKDAHHPNRPYLVGTSGYMAATEGVGEWGAACDALGQPQFHLGPRLPELAKAHIAIHGIPDSDVARAWSACRYVAAMRRGEGFELPGVEGLLCGARPVCFDRPHYKTWYEDAAYFVPENSPAEVTAALVELVEGTDESHRRVGEAEKAWARDRFNWATLVPAFWAKVKEGL